MPTTRSIVLATIVMCGCGDDGPAPEGGTTTDPSTGASTAQGVQSSGSSSSGGGSGNAFPTVEATIDASTACQGATELGLVAARVDCIEAGPCTIAVPPAQTPGTAMPCPADDTAARFVVEIQQTGIYHVELVASLENGSEVRACYGPDGATEVPIGDGELNAKPTIVVEALGAPCEG